MTIKDVFKPEKIGDTLHTPFNVSTQLTETKVLLSVPAISILKGKMSVNTIANVNKYLETVNDNSADSLLVANISGDQSNLDMKHPLMTGFYEEILHGCCTYQNFMSRKIIDVSSERRTMLLAGCWSVKMNPHDYNPMHIHHTDSRNGLATICYTKVPEHVRQDALNSESQELGFGNGKCIRDGLLQFNWDSQNTTVYNDYFPADHRVIIPTVGDYYVFPTWLNHLVYPYRGNGNSNNQRWSVQTNFNVYTDEELKLRNLL